MHNRELVLIHPTAVIDPSAELGQDVEVGPGAYIGPQVTIGDHCVIHHHASVVKNTRIGARNIIHAGSVIGGDPQDKKWQGEETWLDFDEACTRTAIDWLSQKPKGPWCLWAPLIFPHLPFEVERQWYDLYSPGDLPKRIEAPGVGKPQFHHAVRQKLGTDRLTEDDWQEIRRVYYAMISRVDHQLGRILEALQRTGEAATTHLLYFTDHAAYAVDLGLVEKCTSAF